MPEYTAPGVYVEESDFPPRRIEGVNTSTAGFVGPTRHGPTRGPPQLLTSFAEFERAYGDLDPPSGKGAPTHDYLALAARAFFENGGTRLYIARVREGADAEAYAGTGGGDSGGKSGLKVFEDLEDISIVAAPGSTAVATYDGGRAIAAHIIAHCEQMRYRIAVLDALEGQTVDQVRVYRAGLDSKHAALYYPWVRIDDLVTGKEIHVPPSGFIAGIYARNDVERGVHKAPVGQVVKLAIGLERRLSKAEQDMLNPEGINCLRFFRGRGHVVWGARTISSDPEWKYVNVRRYVAYLERSIDRGTRWVVFEPNVPSLWSKIRDIIGAFLLNEWRSGHLMGARPDEAFFVHCDSSTMTQSDVDQGRLICEVGIAPLRPAEFMVFRIGQKTAASCN